MSGDTVWPVERPGVQMIFDHSTSKSLIKSKMAWRWRWRWGGLAPRAESVSICHCFVFNLTSARHSLTEFFPPEPESAARDPPRDERRIFRPGFEWDAARIGSSLEDLSTSRVEATNCLVCFGINSTLDSHEKMSRRKMIPSVQDHRHVCWIRLELI